jgi:hypothetical protein
VGYTPVQAAALKKTLERRVARMEDIAVDIGTLVSDTNEHGALNQALEQIRDVQYRLEAAIDRRMD